MATKDWQIGDVVWLKSGGPAMTVIEATKQDSSTRVSWYETKAIDVERSTYSAANFPKEALTTTDPQIASIREALSSSSALLLPRPESIKVEPITVNWQGAAPYVGMPEMIEKLIAQALEPFLRELQTYTPQPLKTETAKSNERLVEAMAKDKGAASLKGSLDELQRLEQEAKPTQKESRQDQSKQDQPVSKPADRRNARPLT